MKKIIFLSSFLFSTLVFLPLSTGWAQKDYFDITVDELVRDSDEYKPITYLNLSKLYWTIGKFELSDNTAIDQYLRINECPLYQTYYENEFEWEQIREAARESLMNNMAGFITRYEIIVPVEFGRYDTDEEVFWITEETAPTNVHRVDLRGYSVKKICGHDGDLSEYPSQLIIIFNRPFTVQKIEVPTELAQLYLDDVAREFAASGKKVQRVKRPAFIRVKIRISQYKETVRLQSGIKAVVFAKLEGYEVYADAEKWKMLYSENFIDRRIRKVKKRTKPPENTNAETPSTGQPITTPEASVTPTAPVTEQPGTNATPVAETAPPG